MEVGELMIVVVGNKKRQEIRQELAVLSMRTSYHLSEQRAVAMYKHVPVLHIYLKSMSV